MNQYMNGSAGICQVLLYIIDIQTVSVLHMANLLRYIVHGLWSCNLLSLIFLCLNFCMYAYARAHTSRIYAIYTLKSSYNYTEDIISANFFLSFSIYPVTVTFSKVEVGYVQIKHGCCSI